MVQSQGIRQAIFPPVGSGNRRTNSAITLDDPQAPRAFGDEHAPVGQERHAPGMLETRGDGDEVEVATLVVAGGGAGGNTKGERTKQDQLEAIGHAGLLE